VELCINGGEPQYHLTGCCTQTQELRPCGGADPIPPRGLGPPSRPSILVPREVRRSKDSQEGTKPITCSKNSQDETTPITRNKADQWVMIVQHTPEAHILEHHIAPARGLGEGLERRLDLHRGLAAQQAEDRGRTP
jgi:hypothetical protein